MQNPTQSNRARDIEGIERAASIAGGLMLAGKGLRRGGLFGIIQFAIGGVILARGVNEPLAIAQKPDTQDQGSQFLAERYSHMPMDSEVHSPDFESDEVSMPDATQMGNEARADRNAGSKEGKPNGSLG